jgi:hypothetical protein
VAAKEGNRSFVDAEECNDGIIELKPWQEFSEKNKNNVCINIIIVSIGE